jgi:hypothetical protein
MFIDLFLSKKRRGKTQGNSRIGEEDRKKLSVQCRLKNRLGIRDVSLALRQVLREALYGRVVGT